MIFIGIDISKETFMAAFPQANGYLTQSFKNDTKGILGFIQKLDPEQHHCVMEATGNYGFLLLYLLEKKGIKASMVNPKQIKHFARMMLSYSSKIYVHPNRATARGRSSISWGVSLMIFNSC